MRQAVKHGFVLDTADPPFCTKCGWHVWHPNHTDAVVKMVPK
jgi:hypothetical protein